MSSIHRGLRETQRAEHGPRHRPRKAEPDPPKRENRRPDDIHWQIPVPYTSATSEFLYGVNTVLAALRTKKRELYKLYLHRRVDSTSRSALVEAAKDVEGLEVQSVGDDFLPVMKKMSDGRPHNGTILEASPLPLLQVSEMLRAVNGTGSLDVLVGNRVSQRMEGLPFGQSSWRRPFVLLLDGVCDEGNLGNILRTAYYAGVDAVALTARNCAPLSAITLKAASGAAEALAIFSIESPVQFLTASRRQGWRTFAADAPDAPSQGQLVAGRRSAEPGITISPGARAGLQAPPRIPLRHHPSILVLGGEGEGIHPRIRQNVTAFVGLNPAESSIRPQVGLDSLNVSTAAGILTWAFVHGTEMRVDQTQSIGGYRHSAGAAKRSF